MFQYRKEVKNSLWLAVIACAVCGTIAWIDPFNTEAPWISWAVMFVPSLIAIFASLATVIGTDTDGNWAGVMCTIAGVWLVLGGMFCWLFASYVERPYTSVVWGSYAATAVTFVVSGFVHYLFAEHQAQASVTNINRGAA